MMCWCVHGGYSTKSWTCRNLTIIYTGITAFGLQFPVPQCVTNECCYVHIRWDMVRSSPIPRQQQAESLSGSSSHTTIWYSGLSKGAWHRDPQAWVLSRIQTIFWTKIVEQHVSGPKLQQPAPTHSHFSSSHLPMRSAVSSWNRHFTRRYT